MDELNAVLGIVRAAALPEGLDPLMERIQNELFVLGSDLATPGDSARIPRIQESYITQLEQEIDQFETELAPLKNFILPGGTMAAAQLHLARTVCRRVERNIITLAGLEEINRLCCHMSIGFQIGCLCWHGWQMPALVCPM